MFIFPKTINNKQISICLFIYLGVEIKFKVFKFKYEKKVEFFIFYLKFFSLVTKNGVKNCLVHIMKNFHDFHKFFERITKNFKCCLFFLFKLFLITTK